MHPKPLQERSTKETEQTYLEIYKAEKAKRPKVKMSLLEFKTETTGTAKNCHLMLLDTCSVDVGHTSAPVHWRTLRGTDKTCCLHLLMPTGLPQERKALQCPTYTCKRATTLSIQLGNLALA